MHAVSVTEDFLTEDAITVLLLRLGFVKIHVHVKFWGSDA